MCIVVMMLIDCLDCFVVVGQVLLVVVLGDIDVLQVWYQYGVIGDMLVDGGVGVLYFYYYVYCIFGVLFVEYGYFYLFVLFGVIGGDVFWYMYLLVIGVDVCGMLLWLFIINCWVIDEMWFLVECVIVLIEVVVVVFVVGSDLLEVWLCVQFGVFVLQIMVLLWYCD